jgi:uncharacterized protein (DUF1697 family)
MDALRQMYEDLGFQSVQSYIQSGNVLFQSKNTPNSELERTITSKISDVFGFDVPVLVLSLEEMKTVTANNPFVNDRHEDINFLYVTFLADAPDQALIDKIRNEVKSDDEFEVIGKAIYLFCPKNYGKSKLNNNFFESKLKTRATTRNWKTVLELVRIGEGK